MTTMHDAKYEEARQRAFDQRVAEMQSSQEARNQAVSSPWRGTLPERTDDEDTAETFNAHLAHMKAGGTLYSDLNLLHDGQRYHPLSETMKQSLLSTGQLYEVRPNVWLHQARQMSASEVKQEQDQLVAEMSAARARKATDNYGWNAKTGRYSDEAVNRWLTGRGWSERK